MKTIKSKSLFVKALLVLSLFFLGCSSGKYLTPKSQEETLILDEVNSILKNVATNLNETNTKKLQEIEVYLYTKKFHISSSPNKRKLLIPAQGNLTSFIEMEQESYLNTMCGDDLDCQAKLVKYIAIYYSLHELYHMVNSQKYQSKESNAYVRGPNGKLRLSFDEEIRAESVLVKYLSIYEPLLLEEYGVLFSKILKEKEFDMNQENVKQNWNTLKRDFIQTSNAKLYFFLHAKEQIDGRSLEELLFENN